MLIALALAPWLLFFAYLAVRVRMPRPLPDPGTREGPAPRVSVIVPARNEGHNIRRCAESLVRSDYPAFEVLVVDDRSDDDTADVARAVGPGNATAYRVLPGRPLPPGWFGKPWACMQGANAADGDLLLFTDADTAHAPDLLGRAVSGLEDDGADALTLLGRQEMVTFWERLVQPQFFVLLAARFPDARRPLSQDRWRNAVANGQYLLFRREAYDAIQGHRAVAGEVVEDLRLAQTLVKAGRRLSLREAEDAFSTRMYRSLGELVEGWSKNIYTAARQTGPEWTRGWLGPVALVSAIVLWLLPPVVLLSEAWVGAGALTSTAAVWATAATALCVLFWMLVSARVGAPAAYGLLYPLGVGVACFIFVRSWVRGSRIRWKGRTYRGGRSAGGPDRQDDLP